MTKLEAIVEANTEKFPEILDFYEWSLNYEYPSPFSYFLDLIGYSSEELEDTLGDWSKVQEKISYLELSYFAEALTEYVKNPDPAYKLIQELVEVEGDDRVCS